ncbi:hypothetical protein [Sulfitobacter sabulilitoris]|uniref:hypothetical protein n=1 Tax=Sulfitobacter sabulilitoris TaxID=2562655 RepID=UPI00147835B7|nr:hypothetical protein [Sulfitobacter sabulilitoris]
MKAALHIVRTAAARIAPQAPRQPETAERTSRRQPISKQELQALFAVELSYKKAA